MKQLELFESAPRVNLIDYTGAGRPDERDYAANLLLFTKSTRLEMTPTLMSKIRALTDDERAASLDYMANTIPSSWEFVDVTFLISGLSRACAQQVTRTRTASFAMQSQRVTDVSEADVVNPYDSGHELYNVYNDRAGKIKVHYTAMLASGAEPQDARGLLPMNTQCNLVAKYNLRSLVELVVARSSLRTQGEYAQIVDQMKSAVLRIWPWSRPFFEPRHDKAVRLLEELAAEVGVETGNGTGWQLAKIADLLRKG